LEELYAWDDTVATLGERYFQGVNPLMPELDESLDWIVEQTEALVERFNEQLGWEREKQKRSRKRRPALPKPIDIEAVRRAGQTTAEAHVSLLVDIGRAEACDMMGEHDRALAFADRHL
jgi:hypothetical protein